MMITRISSYTPVSYNSSTRQVMSTQNFGRKSGINTDKFQNFTVTEKNLPEIDRLIEEYGVKHFIADKFIGNDHPYTEEAKQFVELMKEAKRIILKKGSCTITEEMIKEIQRRFPKTYDI